MRAIPKIVLVFAIGMVTTAEKCGVTGPEEPSTKYIVEYVPPENPLEALRSSAYADRVRAEVRAAHGLTDNLVGTAGRLPYDFVNLTEEELQRLKADPRVKAIHRNTYRAVQTDQSLQVIEQPKAYSWGATGKGYAVAILDTGADFHQPDLGSCAQPGPTCRVVESLDMTTVDDEQRDASPDKHGTNVAAIVGKVAPEAAIIALDVFEPGGAADSDVLKALNWVIENRARYNIVAVNMSLGSSEGHTVSCDNTVYDTAFDWLLLDGIQVVVAAGNEAVKTGLSNPACHPLAIAVGATTDALTPATKWSKCQDPSLPVDAVACFSNSAASLDILAPGTNISAGGVRLSGTSMAAPHVTGALAALKSKFPNRTNAKLLERLQQTGLLVTDPANGVSVRRINLASAMNDDPKANDDAVIVLQGGGAVVDVLANDVDETPLKMSVAGVLSPAGDDTAFVANNKVYVLISPNSTGTKQFRYTLKDEYGQTAVAAINVTIRPSAFPSPRRVTEEPSFVSRLGKTNAYRFLVYESGTDNDRSVWLQQLDANGGLSGARYKMNGAASVKIQPNDLRVQYDAEGFSAAWLSINYVGTMQVIAVNYRSTMLGTPFPASLTDTQPLRNPTIALLDQAAVVGWERSWDPGKMFAQGFSRETLNPVPITNPQEVSGWINATDYNETVTVEPEKYIHLRTMGHHGIEARKLDARGKADWTEPKKLFESNEPSDDIIGQFNAVRTGNGFALAVSHAQYAGRYSISFQEFNANADPVGAVVPVMTDRYAMGDVDLVRFEDGTYRVFWSEQYPRFSVLLSAAIAGGKAGKPNVEFWTLDSEAFWPYRFDALSLGDKYALSWSNNSRKLTMATRERLPNTTLAPDTIVEAMMMMAPTAAPVQMPSVMHAVMWAAQAVNAFTNQSSGNLATMMLYADRELAETKQQLSELTRTLIDLEAALRATSAADRQAMILQLDDQLVADVRSAAQTYLRYHEMSESNPAIWADPQVRTEMQTLAASLTQIRNRLEARGIGIQSALLAPIVMGVQIAAYARTGVPKPTLKSYVASYRTWIARINGSEAGALADVQKAARGLHDDRINALKPNHLVARSPITNFLLAGNQKSASTTDPCVIFPTITWQGLDARGGLVMNQNAADMAKGMARAVARNSVIAREDTVFKARLIRYDDGPAGYGAPNTPFSTFARVGDYCYVQKVSSMPGVDAAFSAARAWRTKDDADRAALVEGLNRANDARAVIAVAELGKQVITGTMSQTAGF